MERQDVQSSQIRSVGFEDKILEIEFSTGSVYRYDNVEQETFEALMAAESVGKFFGMNIKNNVAKYPFTKIRVSDRELKDQAVISKADQHDGR